MSGNDDTDSGLDRLVTNVAESTWAGLGAWGLAAGAAAVLLGLPGMLIGLAGLVGISTFTGRERWEPPSWWLMRPRRLVAILATLGLGFLYDTMLLYFFSSDHVYWFLANGALSAGASVALLVGRVWSWRRVAGRYGEDAVETFERLAHAAGRQRELDALLRRLRRLANRCEAMRARIARAGASPALEELRTQETDLRARCHDIRLLRDQYDTLIGRLRLDFDSHALERDLLAQADVETDASDEGALTIEFEALEESFTTLDLQREAERELKALLRQR